MTTSSSPAPGAYQSDGFWAGVWHHFRRDPTAMAGLGVVLFLFFVAFSSNLLANSKPLLMKYEGRIYAPALGDYALIGGLFLPSHVARIDYQDFKDEEDLDRVAGLAWAVMPPIPFSPYEQDLDAVLEPPGGMHFLGTDDLGRDVASRLVHGAKISLQVGFISMGIAFLIGVSLGATAGYFGSRTDMVISRLIEIMMCFPTFFLILAVLAMMERAGIFAVMVVIGLTGWTSMARYVRAEVMRVKTLDFSHAAVALGATNSRVILRHILPNSLAPVLVTFTFGVASAILTESVLSFLGFGVQPPTPTWGNLLDLGRQYLTVAWWLAVFPGIAIFLAVFSYNLVGDGFRDAIDPRTAKRSGFWT
jgi:peptide/nickel transport system permease protein